ncbi:MAG: hypothetical protein AAF197_06245 [Pseudomonadota bacterium]
MLLRRITQHLKAQNWFAVFLDFLIVVVGVFIGIQVANWNEERQLRVEEAKIFVRLSEDFARIKQDSLRSRDFHEQLASDLRTLLRSLRAGVLADADIDAVKRALFLGTTIQTSADRSSTTQQLLSSGQANILSDKGLLDQLTAYETFIDRHEQAMGYLLNNMVIMIPAFIGGVQLDIDQPFFSELLSSIDVPPPVGEFDFAALASNKAFDNAAEEILVLQNIALMWRMRIDGRIDDIQRRLEEIE